MRKYKLKNCNLF